MANWLIDAVWISNGDEHKVQVTSTGREALVDAGWTAPEVADERKAA